MDAGSGGGLFSGGMPMGKLTLQILTLFPPTGLTGINLSAAGMPIAALAKAGVFGLGAVLALLTKTFYAEFFVPVFTFLMFLLPPWYIFDCIQVLMDPDFEENGFQPPLPIKDIPSGGGKGGSWILTPSTLSLILAALTASGFGVVAKYFPGFGSEGVGKYTQYAALGGSAALAIGGLAGSVFSKSTPQTESPQTGGGIRASGIVTRKTLADVARQMSGSGVSKRSLPTDTTEGVTFLGILGMVVVGGITLSYLRSL